MRTLLFMVATVVMLLTTTTASAALPIEYLELPPDTTMPTVSTCKAYDAYGQRCRMCWATFRTDGSVEKWTCVQVKNSQNFCTCGDMSRGGCYPKGLCQYVG